jgi:hypothetical protein
MADEDELLAHVATLDAKAKQARREPVWRMLGDHAIIRAASTAPQPSSGG